MTGENGTPETPDWTPPGPKCCPFANCRVCETTQQAIWLHGSDNVILGEN